MVKFLLRRVFTSSLSCLLTCSVVFQGALSASVYSAQAYHSHVIPLKALLVTSESFTGTLLLNLPSFGGGTPPPNALAVSLAAIYRKIHLAVHTT